MYMVAFFRENLLCAQKIECEMFLCEAEDSLPVTQNCVHSQQGEQETVYSLVSLFPSLSLPPLSLLPIDSRLSFRDSGLSVNPDLIIYKVCAHLLPQACPAAGGRTSVNSCCSAPQVPAEGPQKLPSPMVT